VMSVAGVMRGFLFVNGSSMRRYKTRAKHEAPEAAAHVVGERPTILRFWALLAARGAPCLAPQVTMD
jgi:hypothetical protein